MAEIKPQDLVYTYIKLSKSVAVYTTPEAGDSNKPWFTKQAGEIAGRLFSWVDTSPITGKKYQSLYLMFKVNDDFSNTSKPYFIKLQKEVIDWSFTKYQLIQKGQADMNFFEKFIDDIENKAIDYGNDILNYGKSGLKWGMILGGIYLFIGAVVIPELRFRRMKSTAKELIREARR
jgi:hypothetical protein